MEMTDSVRIVENTTGDTSMRLSAMERDDAVEEQQAMLKHQSTAQDHSGVCPAIKKPNCPLSRDDVYFLIKLCKKDIEDIKERARSQANEGQDMDVVRDTLKNVDGVKEVIARLNQQL